MIRLAAMLALGLLAGCAEKPRIAPPLVPMSGAAIWPNPPETPRFAYAGTLTGERDFRAPEGAEIRSAGQQIIEAITGFIFGEAPPLELKRPVAGLVDGRGNLYVTDAGQQAVMVFDMVEKEFRRWFAVSEDADFVSPVAIAEDGRGGFLVTDSELGAVVRLDGTGNPAGMLGSDSLKRPTGIARDPETGRIFVTDTALHQVLVFSSEGELLDSIGARGSAPGRFNYPTLLTIAGRQLFVADTLNFRIQVFDLTGDGKLAFGRLGINVGDLTRPKGVAVGADGRVYVVESYFDHLLVYDGAGRLLLPIGGTGDEVGQFYLPSGVWTDGRGLVYVADMFNGRIAVFQELTRGTDG